MEAETKPLKTEEKFKNTVSRLKLLAMRLELGYDCKRVYTVNYEESKKLQEGVDKIYEAIRILQSVKE
jgi:hypothetical protein